MKIKFIVGDYEYIYITEMKIGIFYSCGIVWVNFPRTNANKQENAVDLNFLASTEAHP